MKQEPLRRLEDDGASLAAPGHHRAYPCLVFRSTQSPPDHVSTFPSATGGRVLANGSSLAFVAFYIHDQLPSYWDFFEEYPYMRGHWLAVLATDYCYIIQDYWGWMTVWMVSLPLRPGPGRGLLWTS